MTEHEAVRHVLVSYCWSADNSRWDEWLELFSATATWSAEGIGNFEGRDAIAEFAASIEEGRADGAQARHFLSNEVIQIDGDAARLKAYVLVVRTGPSSMGVGDYDVALRKLDGRWRIEHLKFCRPVAKP